MPAQKILGRFFNATEDQVASITTDSTEESSKALSLEVLLAKSAKLPQVHRQLSDKDRLRIALLLASAVLQLYDSPWLDSAWSGRDIHFLLSTIADSCEPAIDGPFVSSLFRMSSNAPKPQRHAPTTSSLVDILIPSKVLFALAVMLVELCLDKTLLELRQHADDGDIEAQKSTLLDDYETANKQLIAIYQKSGPNYGDVVQRCLRCEFNIIPEQKTLGHEAYRQLFYEGVVAPLEDNYQKYLLYRGDIRS